MKPDKANDHRSPENDPSISEASRVDRRQFMKIAGASGAAMAGGSVAASSVSASASSHATEANLNLAQSGATASATPAAGASATDALPPEVPPWTKTWGPPPSEYGERSSFESHVVRQPSATSSRTPLQDLQGTMTPNSLFYERHHAGVPDIDPSLHRLIVHGMVDKPMIFTMDDIRRFPSVSVIHFLECSGNSGSEWREESIAETAQAGFGLVSQTEWTGVPLKTILDQVGVSADATWLLAEGADAAAMDRSVPIEKALNDALLVYAMNGEALRPANGYPLRLVLPGWEGNANIKWLRRIKLGTGPWETREETSKYTDLMPDGTARQFTFVMEAKSVITFPSGGHTLPGHGFYEISGIAWSGRGKITRVDISVDGGETWEQAELQNPVLPIALTRFRLPWIWDGTSARIMSRAEDETGYIQPTIQQLVDVRGTRSTYHMNGIKSWAIDENGEVSSAWG